MPPTAGIGLVPGLSGYSATVVPLIRLPCGKLLKILRYFGINAVKFSGLQQTKI
jgi:hypothetical protein